MISTPKQLTTLKRIPSTRKVSRLILFNLVLTILLFLIIEGLFSVIFVAKEFTSERFPHARRHTQYDEEIGWINVPNLYIKDMYGPGIFYKTNAMGFRNDKDFSFSIPSNKVRMICSGDSMTMGFGVDNDNAWCKLLESIDDRIESVNLGQAGYGVDQAYLWYKRNSTKLEHSIHVFSFITYDFDRMQTGSFSLDWGKPLFELKNGALLNKNRPVPRPFRLRKVRPAIRQLNSVKVLTEIFFRKRPATLLERDNQLERDVQKEKQTQEIAASIFKHLQEINKAKNSILVLVYLPIKGDFMEMNSEPWRQFLHAEALKSNLLFIDLIDEFRKSPPQEVNALFSDLWHYTEKGNLYIAALLYKKLLAIPEIADKFQQKASSK